MSPSNPSPVLSAQSVEAYRLWFEFLKRAIALDRSKIRLDLYAAWGDVGSYEFERWWDEIGCRVIELHPARIEHVDAGKADEVSYLLRVPKSMTSTEISTQVRKYLISLGHQPLQVSNLRFKVGAEIRPRYFRALLHTYDQQKKLEEKYPDRKITGIELLKKVRRFYIETEKKKGDTGKTADSVWRVDSIPPALITGMDHENPYEIDLIDNEGTIAAVKRYLRNANKIIEAVREGRFPE
jgi:hypothetical protein